jgi:hypothetical protein
MSDMNNIVFELNDTPVPAPLVIQPEVEVTSAPAPLVIQPEVEVTPAPEPLVIQPEVEVTPAPEPLVIQPEVEVTPAPAPAPAPEPVPAPESVQSNTPVFEPRKPDNSKLQNTFENMEVPFERRIADYVEKYRPVVYLLTPCFASLCYCTYVQCMMNTQNVFRELNIPLEIQFCRNDSLVSRARNNLVAKAMNDPKMTHIIFIDNDISWSPVDILKLLLANKPLVGGLYPLKKYNWKKLLVKNENNENVNVIQSWLDRRNKSNITSHVSDESYLQHNLLNYNVNYLASTISIENNLTKVKHLATGFMMIQRGMLEMMFKAFPSTKYRDDVGFLNGTEHDFAYALFDCGVEDDHYYSEDWLFCHRWTKMGGDIYIDVTIGLVHTGIEDFNGSYLASIM